jgi:hypothetical protein
LRRSQVEGRESRALVLGLPSTVALVIRSRRGWRQLIELKTS